MEAFGVASDYKVYNEMNVSIELIESEMSECN